MSPCLEQQMVSLVEYTRDERRKLLDACKEYRATLDEANRRIDELRDQLTCTQNARDDAKRELAEAKARLDTFEAKRERRSNPWVIGGIQWPPADVDLEILADGHFDRPRLARYVPSLFLSGWLLRDTPPGPVKVFITFEGTRWRYSEQPAVPPAQPLS